MATRRTVMNAFGKYLTYAGHLAKIKRSEVDGDLADFAKACAQLEHEYLTKIDEFLKREQ